MKKKVKITVSLLAILFAILIIGICVYVNVPFFVINWLQILGTVMTFCVIGIYIWVLYRFQLWNKIIRFIITKRKTFLIILGSFAAVGIGVLILHLMVPKRDSEWGIGLKVVKSSREEIIFELTREDEKKPWDIITGNSYGVERWTLLGWKDVRGSSMTTMEGILVSEEFSHQWLAETMYDDGHMPSGLYRIVKNVTVEGYYKYDATGIESMELTYYAPFFIGVWWEILLIIIGIVLLPLIVWAERRFKLIRRGWKKVVQYRKQSVLIMSAILLLLLLARVVHIFWGSEISAAVHGYEIEIEEINEEIFLGKIRYLEDDNEKERRFLRPKQEFELQALTLLGWQTIQKEKGNALIQPVAVREGNGAAMRWYWKDEIDKLEPGTYRIKQPFDLYQKSKGEKPGGNVYVEFEIE